MTPKAIAILLAHGSAGWALCGATMGVGLVAAPLFFIAISWLYFRRFGHTGPLPTAAAFTAIVVLLDVFVVALPIERSFAMFAIPLGTWLPFAPIFLATYIT